MNDRKSHIKLTDIAIGTAIVLLLPVMLPYVWIQKSLEGRRRTRLADQFTCVRCGSVLGTAALRSADAYERERIRDLRRQYPEGRICSRRTVWAVCTCGSRYHYRDREQTFVLINAGEVQVKEALEVS